MTTPTSEQSSREREALQPCPYCGNPIETPVARKIIDRGYNPVLRRQYVRTREVEFCTPQCGGNYQMGCEG